MNTKCLSYLQTMYTRHWENLNLKIFFNSFSLNVVEKIIQIKNPDLEQLALCYNIDGITWGTVFFIQYIINFACYFYWF